MKLIVTDLSYRKAFDIFHIFKSKGYEITAFSSSGRIERLLLSLIYRQKVHLLRKDHNFLQDLQKALESDRSYLYFPVEEDTTLLFYEVKEDHKLENVLALLPEKKTMELVRDKKTFSNFCVANRLPVPKAYDFDTLVKMDALPSPLIIKPRIGSGSMGIVFVDTKEELLACSSMDFSEYLIQERLENSSDVEGAFFLMDKGNIVSYYGHKRIRTYPPEGGVSIFSRCDMNETLKKTGAEVLARLEYSGLAMVEFLYDVRSGDYKIIEINPRAWGSIMLSEHCGANMLENYVRLAVGKDIVPANIDKDRYIRWVFPWDLLGYIKAKGKIENFWKYDPACCYINFTYAPGASALLFTLYNLVNPAKIGKFFRKVFS